MDAKEKAQELLDKMTMEIGKFNSKQCAFIAVDEVINSNPHSNPFNTEPFSTMDYWIDVKNEIENL